MKSGLAFVLFLFIGTLISFGMDELLTYLNYEYIWSMNERAMRWIVIVFSCGIGIPLSNYLADKIKEYRK